MARPRKNLETQNKHLTKQEIQEKELTEKSVKAPDDELGKPPTWLRDSVAKKEWKRLINNFKQVGIISNLDLNNLGSYCNAYSFYREATKDMKGQPLTIEYTNKGGQVNSIENPLIKIQIKYSDEMKKYSSLLGLTVDSRLKLGQIKLDKQKDKIGDTFGDI